jgi:hypothetical protein
MLGVPSKRMTSSSLSGSKSPIDVYFDLVRQTARVSSKGHHGLSLGLG